MALKGKVALVTGSTSGIGLGITEALADEGADIVMNGFGDPAQIETVRADLAARGVRVVYSPADISKPADCEAMVKLAHDSFGSLDILVNNAGVQYVSDIADFPAEQWDRVIAINLSGAFHAMHFAIPGMKAKGWGRIINISSAHGLVASPQKAAYVAAKHGIIGLTKVAALELANDGITANSICPGWVLTPLVQKQLEDRAAKEGTSVEAMAQEFLKEKQPMLQFSTAKEIGGLAVFLCSDNAKTITGTSMSIDGGWVAE